MNAPAAAVTIDRRLTVARAIGEHASQRPDAVAFRFVGRHAANTRQLTWSELERSARPAAAALRDRGLTGKRVAIVCPDPKDFVVALCGTFGAGAAAVPVPAVATRRSADRIRSIVDAARPSVILAPAAVLGQPWIASLLEDDGMAGLALDRLDEPSAAVPTPAEEPAAGALVQFTSGSTGLPRGVILSHANLSANCAAIVETCDLSPATRGFSWLPLHHDMGLVGHILAPLWIGCRSTLMDPLLFLQSPLRWLQHIGEEQATITSAPNFAYELCVREAEKSGIEGIDLSSLSVAVCGGEPVWPETVERFCEIFAPAGFARGAFAPSYGLAEATLLVSSGRRAGGPSVFSGVVKDAGESGDTDVRTVNLGRPVRGVTVRIVDASGGECPEATIGEIEISGESVGHPSAEGNGPGVDGPILTGDLGFLSGGDLHISGRRKELIILRGQNVYPADIENAAVRADPAIRPGAVAAVAVRDKGTEALLLVFEAEGRAVDPEAFAATCRRVNQAVAQATGHVPSRTLIVPYGKLPRTTSGKIKRNQVGALCRAGLLPVLAATGEAQAPQEAITS